MSANIRIGQQLSTGYNPDGTPGTVSTGLPGPAGPPPTDAQVQAAVSTYLQGNPASGSPSTSTAGFKKLSTGVVTNDTDFLAVGVGVDGSGAWVGLGTAGSTVDGYVYVDSTADNADLHLKAKGPTGRIWVNAPITTAHQNVTIDSQLVVTGITTVDALVAKSTIAFTDTIDSNISVGSLDVGYNTFDSSTAGGFYLANAWVSVGPFGGQGNPAGIAVRNNTSAGYCSVSASAFNVSSDRRLKSEITPLVEALEEVRTTQAYSYVMNGERRRGLIADEAPADIVRTDEHGFQMIESYDLVGTLWAAVRELATKIEGMEQTCRCQPTR